MKLNNIYVIVLLIFIPVIGNTTNGYFAHGTGIKTRALAGAGAALPLDTMAAATNPAGMVFIGNQFDVGTILFHPDRGYSSSESLANGAGGHLLLVLRLKTAVMIYS